MTTDAHPRITEGFLTEMVQIEAHSDAAALRIAADWIEGDELTLLGVMNLAKDATGGNITVIQLFVERGTSDDHEGDEA